MRTRLETVMLYKLSGILIQKNVSLYNGASIALALKYHVMIWSMRGLFISSSSIYLWPLAKMFKIICSFSIFIWDWVKEWMCTHIFLFSMIVKCSYYIIIK